MFLGNAGKVLNHIRCWATKQEAGVGRELDALEEELDRCIARELGLSLAEVDNLHWSTEVYSAEVLRSYQNLVWWYFRRTYPTVRISKKAIEC